MCLDGIRGRILAGLAVNRPSLRSWDASSNPDWSSSFCTCPCLSLRIRGGMRGTRGARRGPSSKGLCQVQGGCSLREADGRSGGHPMVDRISLPKARNIKSMSWITPAGATLSRNLRIPILLRQELVRTESSSSERRVPPAAGGGCSLLLKRGLP